MNISATEVPLKIIAKTYPCKEGSNKKVIYSLTDTYHSDYVDKKDILSAELEACERLSKNATDESERTAIETEISELKMALDLLP
jgi:transcription initiation factor IIE alpha subunit